MWRQKHWNPWQKITHTQKAQKSKQNFTGTVELPTLPTSSLHGLWNLVCKTGKGPGMFFPGKTTLYWMESSCLTEVICYSGWSAICPVNGAIFQLLDLTEVWEEPGWWRKGCGQGHFLWQVNKAVSDEETVSLVITTGRSSARDKSQRHRQLHTH